MRSWLYGQEKRHADRNNRGQVQEQEANDWDVDKSKRQLDQEATDKERAPHVKG